MMLKACILSLLIALDFSAAVTAQEPTPPAAPAVPAVPPAGPGGGASPPQPGGLTEAAVESLGKALCEWRDLSEKAADQTLDSKGRDKLEKLRNASETTFKGEIQKVKDAEKGKDILTMVDSWARVFARALALKKTTKPEGLGRLQDRKRIEFKDKGHDLAFEYAYWAPQGYDPKKSWPVIIALHDKGATDGGKYLNEVWLKNNDAEFKALRDQFIFVAPTIGEKTVGKDSKVQIRVDFMDQWHEYGIKRCLLEMMGVFNIDTSRIYIDGCGVGGQAGVELAMMRPKFFAAVAGRSTDPKTPRFLPNLKNATSLLFVNREDGIFSGDVGKEHKDTIKKHQANHGLDIEFKDYAPIAREQRRQALGSQTLDPVTEASADVLRYFLSKKRNANPNAFYFCSNNLRRFNRAVWAVVVKGDADPTLGTEIVLAATVDRAANVIDVTKAENIESFRLYLNDRIVDLDRPIKIKVKGKTVKEEKIDRTLDYLIEYNRQNVIDPSSVMLGEVQITVPVEEPAAPEGEKKDGK